MSNRPGFSLLELVLAVGLSIALVTLLGFAIDLHLTKLDASRSTIERAQLARSILDRIAADLAAATAAPTQDVSELLAAAESSSQFDVDEVDQSADDSSESTDEPTLFPAGITGADAELVIDRRRVTQALASLEASAQPAARVEAAWARVRYAMSSDPGSAGLVRTERSRDEEVWLAEQGETAAAATPIASEVLSFALRYFDGEQYLPEWDMADRESLPQAVEVTIELASFEEETGPNTSEAVRASRSFRRLVRLPAAPNENRSDAGDTDAEAESI